MHLNFDTNPVKHGEQKVQDDSGNKNDAALVNGAEISNRTMGILQFHVSFIDCFMLSLFSWKILSLFEIMGKTTNIKPDVCI